MKRRYSRGAGATIGKPPIVNSGLILNLSGKDFTNSPATALWYDRLNFNPENILKYNPLTWVSWGKTSNVTVDSTGILLSSVGADIYGYHTIPAKYSTKYGVLYNVVSSTLSTDLLKFGGGAAANKVWNEVSVPKAVGNNKWTGTSLAAGTFTDGSGRFYIQVKGAATESIKVNNIRVFELVAGSQLEADFTNLTADQLVAKYPATKVAIPSGFEYTTSSGSNGKGGVVFDGTDGKCSVTGTLTGNTPITICFRGKFLTAYATTKVPVMYGTDTPASNQELGLFVGSSSKFKVSTYGGIDYDTGWDKDLEVHDWALVYDGSSILCYKDGVADPVGAKAVTLNFVAPVSLKLGYSGSASHYTNFELYRCLVYNRALTQQEIKQNKAAR